MSSEQSMSLQTAPEAQGTDNGLVHALLLDGVGGARLLDRSSLEAHRPEHGVLWVHLDYQAQGAQDWLMQQQALGLLDEVVVEALLAEETRPRSTLHGAGCLLALRGINLNPGADPEDMVSVRVWADASRLVTTRHRPLQAARTVAKDLQNGQGPSTAGELVVALADCLTEPVEICLEAFEDRMDELEEAVIDGGGASLRSALSGLRREAITLRRYLAPQREAIARLASELKVGWLSETDRIRLREVGDRMSRHVEDLDALRDRAAVTQEELSAHLSEEMNSRMYVLSMVAAVFLPLGFLTGLLGINVGGIPGADNPLGFWVFLVLLIGVLVAQVWVFRRRHWL